MGQFGKAMQRINMLFQIFAIVAISCTVSGIKMVANLSEETSFIGALMPGKAPMGVPAVEERQSGCIDVYPSHCPGWSNAGYCSGTYGTWMAKNCEKTCGGCGCIDVYPSYCPGWSNAGYCSGTYGTWMAENCEKSCGGCGQQGGCAQIPSWMKAAIEQKSGLGRIIQGQTAPEPIPWQAHMRQGSPWSFSYFCGGTILDAKTILTAAHCYYGKDLNAGNFFIAAGAVHLQDASAQTAFVESITLHESYNPTTINNDLAILKLKTPLTFNDKVRPACLPDASFNPEGIAVASGWGLTGQFPDVRPFDLQYVTKPVIVRDQCTQPNTLWGSDQITAGMICAGDDDGGESICMGDSGGPLIVSKSSTDDTAVVIGASSFVAEVGCGAKDLPSVYAYVTNYLDWIQPKMEK